MRRVIAALSATMLLMVAVAGPAMAAKPVIEVIELHESFDIDCGTFLLHEEVDLSVRELRWLDSEGNPERTIAHATFDGVITGPGGIVSLADPGHITNFVSVDDAGETLRQVGLIFSFTVPGIGLVAHDVGTITFFPDDTVEYSGPHDVFDQGDEGVAPLICGLFED